MNEIDDFLAGPQAKLSGMLCFALYSTHHVMNKVYKKLLQETQLTYPQFLVMVILWEEDNLSVSHIGDLLLIKSSTLTPLLKRLEVIGYIKRIRDVNDERKVRIQLTEQGRKLRCKTDCFDQLLTAASGMPVDDIEKLCEGVLSLRQQLTSNIDKV